MIHFARHIIDSKISFELDFSGTILQVSSPLEGQDWSVFAQKKLRDILTIANKNGPLEFDQLAQANATNHYRIQAETSDWQDVVVEVERTPNSVRLTITSIEFFISEFSLLQENELRFRGLYENLSEGVFMLDSTGLIIEWNKAACAIYERTDFLGCYITEFFPHNSDQENELYWKGFMKTSIIEGFYKYTTPSGALRYIEFTGKANVYRGLHLAVFSDLTEKKNTEKALLQSQANLKTIFDYSDQNILLVNPDYTVVAANPSAQKISLAIFGKAMELPCNVLDYIVNKEEFQNEFERAKTGQHVVSERPLKLLNNSEIWMEFNFLPIFDKKGAVKNICFTAKDITSRKRKSIVLENSEKRFRQLAENSPDIIYIIDLYDRKITYINRPTIFGYESTEMLGPEVWREIVHPEDVLEVQNHWKKFLLRNNNKVDSIEYRIRTKDDEYEWVHNRHLVIERNERKEPVKVLLNITVVTERKNAEVALRESESKLTALIENTTDLVWSIDKNYQLTASNSAFRKLIFSNYQVEIRNGDKLVDKIRAIDKDGWLELHKSALNGKRVTAEFSWQSDNNENLFYEITYNPIHDTGEEVIGVSVFARDITQRKLNEAVIIQTNFELDSFVYRASHDLRAPLRSILGLAAIIKTEENEKEKLRYLGLIEKSALKLDTFINDLINFSRNSRMSLDIDEIDFRAILQDARENLRFMEDADRVTLNESIQQQVPFYSDMKRIHIFLNNLLSNSIKYQSYSSDRAPLINVSIESDKDRAIIVLEDNGIGIQEKYLPRIFDMFFRASEKSFGSGLGLYIVKQSIERLGGSIRVSSQPNKGTRFDIILPNKACELPQNQ